jgi:hypothetical protein
MMARLIRERIGETKSDANLGEKLKSLQLHSQLSVKTLSRKDSAKEEDINDPSS